MPNTSGFLLRVEEGRWREIPYALGMKDDFPFVFAGLCEQWAENLLRVQYAQEEIT